MCGCTNPKGCLPSRCGRGGIGIGSGLGAVVTSGVGQGKESSDEVAYSERGWSVVYGVCTALSDRLLAGIRVWG